MDTDIWTWTESKKLDWFLQTIMIFLVAELIPDEMEVIRMLLEFQPTLPNMHIVTHLDTSYISNNLSHNILYKYIYKSPTYLSIIQR